MLFISGCIAILSLMLGSEVSWTAAIGMVVILVGVFRCIDGIASETTQSLLFNLQGGILDVVVGFLVVFSPGNEVNYLNLLIVGYLITQGIYRIIILTVAEIHNLIPNSISGLISIILGVMIWVDWPESMWFIAFSMSIDICFRGWAMIAMASSLKKDRS